MAVLVNFPGSLARVRDAASRLPKGRALIGREDDLLRIVAAIEQGERLLTLLGPPGIGKTSLAMHAADVVAPRFADGASVWFVDLSNAHDEAALCFSVLSRIDEKIEPGRGASATDVGALLARKGPALLVLDNFEQLSAVATVVDAWSRVAPSLLMIVTSRERLAVDVEHVIELAPLSCPRAGAGRDLVLSSEAVQLFRARARDAGARPSDDVEAIAEIVRRLDGIPLAIELAAARTRLLAPRELAARLGRGEDVLGTASKRSHLRHRTLSDAIEWSWSLLTPGEQTALVCCSAFSASFDVGSAERLVDAELERAGDVPGSKAVELIAALREKSLVHVTGDDRLALYLSIREFAARKLDERGAESAIAVRLDHARLFGELSSRFVDSRLLQNATPDPTLLSTALREKAHVVAALSFVAGLAPSHERASLRARLASASAFSFALPSESADREIAAALADPLVDARAASLLLLARQSVQNALGRYDECLEASRKVLDLADAPFGLRCFALVNSGVLLRARGNARAAWELHEEAAALLGADPSFPRLVGMNTACMGRLQCDFSNAERAHELNNLATEMCDRLGDRWLAGLGLANLAQLEQEQQSFDRALELLSRALERFRETGEPQYEAIYAGICGGLYFEWGKHELARHWYEVAQSTLESLVPPFPRVVLHGGRASLEATSGNEVEARTHLELARRHAARAPSAIVRLVIEAHTATVELLTGNPKGSAIAALRARLDELLRGQSEDAGLVRSNIDARFATRMLEKTLAKLGEPDSAGPVVHTAKDGLWFSIDRGPRVDLGRRGSLRRILVALREERSARPGGTLGIETLTERGWPNERILVEAASTRVRVAIATLRKLGLRDVLLTRDDGYLLDPEARIEQG